MVLVVLPHHPPTIVVVHYATLDCSVLYIYHHNFLPNNGETLSHADNKNLYYVSAFVNVLPSHDQDHNQPLTSSQGAMDGMVWQ